jgi:hypothetical protein
MGEQHIPFINKQNRTPNPEGEQRYCGFARRTIRVVLGLDDACHEGPALVERVYVTRPSGHSGSNAPRRNKVRDVFDGGLSGVARHALISLFGGVGHFQGRLLLTPATFDSISDGSEVSTKPMVKYVLGD